jgi:hypothetical protein
VVVDHYIDLLVEAAEAAGERKGLPRSELTAALVVSVRRDGPALKKCLESYRQMLNRDLIGDVTSLKAHGPGRRRA